MNILLQPASGPEAQGHYKDTIEPGVPLERLRKLLPDSDFQWLLGLKSGTIKVWGLKPKKDNSRRPEWNDLNPGDPVLFYKDRAFFYLTEVYLKVHNPRLAKELWGMADDGRTWEYIYFVKEGRRVAIPFRPQLLGYAPNKVLMGATLLKGRDVATIQTEISRYTGFKVNKVSTARQTQGSERLYTIIPSISVPILRDATTIPYRRESVVSKNKRESGFVDFDALNKRKGQIGKKGEEVVFNHERNYLKSIGRLDLVRRVDWVSLRDHSLGYDILSFDQFGNEKRIEVKSTISSPPRRFQFIVTENELRIGEESENYYIYFVSNVYGKNPGILPLKDPFNNRDILIAPHQFKVSGRLNKD